VLDSLTIEQWAEIDALIVAGAIIPGMAYIQKACGCRLPEARDLFKARYRQPRAEQGAEFAQSDEEYWSCYGEDLADAIAKGW
jgi:hypothetical protein